MRDLVSCSALVLFGLGCATTASRPPVVAEPVEVATTAAPSGEPVVVKPGLRFHVQPVDAQVLVDDEPRGASGDVGGGSGVLELLPGIHRIALKRAGYQTWRGEVTVGQKVELLEVALEKRR